MAWSARSRRRPAEMRAAVRVGGRPAAQRRRRRQQPKAVSAAWPVPQRAPRAALEDPLSTAQPERVVTPTRARQRLLRTGGRPRPERRQPAAQGVPPRKVLPATAARLTP